VSHHISSNLQKTLNDFAAGKALSLDDLVGTLPLLAEQSIRHAVATGDESIARNWHNIASQLVEAGFSLNAPRNGVASY